MASGTVRVHDMKSPPVDVNRATDGDVIDGIGTRSSLKNETLFPENE